MNLSSHLMQRVLRLDPPLTRDLIVERDLRVPMPDGAVLLADRYLPRAGGQALRSRCGAPPPSSCRSARPSSRHSPGAYLPLRPLRLP